ncbi:sensor histidine kinase [Parapedobacter sp. DT-150]|uniref:sensor histidine kinase n=1 Tax=Parapedobacter sp. DT-150 TaxID=3396162 RepID=UPI003F1CD005
MDICLLSAVQGTEDLSGVIIKLTLLFLLVPIFLTVYIYTAQRAKLRHQREKEALAVNFERERILAELEASKAAREHIAADLHDSLGQVLSLMVIELRNMAGGPQKAIARGLPRVTELGEKGLKELRTVAKTIREHEPLIHGLGMAFQAEVRYLEELGYFSISLDMPEGYEPPLGPDRGILLFRIFQESMNNILKHAKATWVAVALRPEGTDTMLRIVDNGCGFDLDHAMAHGGSGLHNIRQRTRLLGGACKIHSLVGAGTSITIHVPNHGTS